MLLPDVLICLLHCFVHLHCICCLMVLLCLLRFFVRLQCICCLIVLICLLRFFVHLHCIKCCCLVVLICLLHCFVHLHCIKCCCLMVRCFVYLHYICCQSRYLAELNYLAQQVRWLGRTTGHQILLVLFPGRRDLMYIRLTGR